MPRQFMAGSLGRCNTGQPENPKAVPVAVLTLPAAPRGFLRESKLQVTPMSSIIPFSFEATEIRAITNDQGEPWFVASDVAEVLGYRDAANMTRLLDDDEKGTHNLSTLGGEQEMTVISESGLYACILKSRRPEAKAFRKWVTGEVLPTLRKTGRYAVSVEPTINPAQQRQLQNAIAARFPDGKQRPYAWSRFNNHFGLGSYKQLPAAKTEEALAYLAQMAGGVDETERTRAAREVLRFARLLLTYDRHGLMHLQEVPEAAYIVTAEELPGLVGADNSFCPRGLLPSLIHAAAGRLRA
jgi:prophage antirepressor-like protein